MGSIPSQKGETGSITRTQQADAANAPHRDGVGENLEMKLPWGRSRGAAIGEMDLPHLARGGTHHEDHSQPGRESQAGGVTNPGSKRSSEEQFRRLRTHRREGQGAIWMARKAHIWRDWQEWRQAGRQRASTDDDHVKHPRQRQQREAEWERGLRTLFGGE